MIQGATIHPKDANESPTAATSIRSLAGCLCGCGMRAKIDGSGCSRVVLAINVTRDGAGAIVGCRAVNYPVTWSKSKSVVRFSTTGNEGPPGGDLGERL